MMPRRQKWAFTGAFDLGKRHGGKLLTFKRGVKIREGAFAGRVGYYSRSFTKNDIMSIRRRK